MEGIKSGLVLTRRVNERLRLVVNGGEGVEPVVIWLEIAEVHSGRVRLRLAAPPCVEILRSELIKREGNEQ